MSVDPASGLQMYTSREEYRAALSTCPPPTADDCTVLRDGTRIDTPAKARAYMADLRAAVASEPTTATI